MNRAFVGTGALVRLILRRDRLALLIWIVLPVLLVLATKASFAQLYPTPALLQGFAQEVASNPAEVALLGHVYTPTLASIVVWRVSMMSAVLIALANIFTVTRHTRSEEEAGRRELLGSTPIGRHAPLLAVLLVTSAADLLIALLVAVSLSSTGFSVPGSFALGLSLAAIGWTFAALAALTAQVTESPGAANGIAGALFALCYLLRAVGDSSPQDTLSWLSPLGWMRLIRPYAAERWWIFALFIALTALLSILAFSLAAHRDLGAGLLVPRLGPASASPALHSPLALTWRLQRGMLFFWTLGAAVVGLAFGFVATSVADQLSTNPAVMRLLAHAGHNITAGDGFFALALQIVGEVAAAYTILAALHLRSEEVRGRADPILATTVGRIRWALSSLVFAALGSAVVLAAFGLAAGLTYGLSTGTVYTELPRVLVSSLAYLPAAWVLGGLAVLLFGLLPRLSVAISWALLGFCLLLDFAGELQQVNQTILNISPFSHVPKFLIAQASPLPLLILAAVAVALTLFGLVGFRQRAIG